MVLRAIAPPFFLPLLLSLCWFIFVSINFLWHYWEMILQAGLGALAAELSGSFAG
jgi:hypothetical protein